MVQVELIERNGGTLTVEVSTRKNHRAHQRRWREREGEGERERRGGERKQKKEKKEMKLIWEKSKGKREELVVEVGEGRRGGRREKMEL